MNYKNIPGMLSKLFKKNHDNRKKDVFGNYDQDDYGGFEFDYYKVVFSVNETLFLDLINKELSLHEPKIYEEDTIYKTILSKSPEKDLYLTRLSKEITCFRYVERNPHNSISMLIFRNHKPMLSFIVVKSNNNYSWIIKQIKEYISPSDWYILSKENSDNILYGKNDDSGHLAPKNAKLREMTTYCRSLFVLLIKKILLKKTIYSNLDNLNNEWREINDSIRKARRNNKVSNLLNTKEEDLILDIDTLDSEVTLTLTPDGYKIANK